MEKKKTVPERIKFVKKSCCYKNIDLTLEIYLCIIEIAHALTFSRGK